MEICRELCDFLGIYGSVYVYRYIYLYRQGLSRLMGIYPETEAERENGKGNGSGLP